MQRPALLAPHYLCLVFLALNPHTPVAVDAKYPKLFIAVAKKEAPVLVERASSSFLLHHDTCASGGGTTASIVAPGGTHIPELLRLAREGGKLLQFIFTSARIILLKQQQEIPLMLL